MIRISHSELAAARDQFDLAVKRTPEISRFCSSSIWGLAAREHLLALGEEDEDAEDDEGEKNGSRLRVLAAALSADTAIWRDEAGERWMLFGRSPWGYWQPFESAWMFACPLIGPEPEESLELLRQAAETEPELGRGCVIGGIPSGGRLHLALRRASLDWARGFREFPGTDSLGIDLSRGLDAWLGRRTRKFRRSLRGAVSRCREAGLEIEEIQEGGGAVFDRLMALQPRTGKWQRGSDIFLAPGYRDFYRQVLLELERRGDLRVLVALREGEDAGYLFGGMFEREFRGLQMSFAAEHASLGLGNWLQRESLERRAAEGVTHYDLGMDAPYKVRWADARRPQTVAFLHP